MNDLCEFVFRVQSNADVVEPLGHIEGSQRALKELVRAALESVAAVAVRDALASSFSCGDGIRSKAACLSLSIAMNFAQDSFISAGMSAITWSSGPLPSSALGMARA